MPNDPLIRATRVFSCAAGLTLLLFPIVALILDVLELRTLPVRWSRDAAGFMLLVAFTLFASVMLHFTLTISRVAERLLPKESEAPAAAVGRRTRVPRRLVGAIAALVTCAVVLDHFAVQRLEKQLVERSRDSIAHLATGIERMGAYRYTQGWLDDATLNLKLIERQGSYSSVLLIVQDSIDGQPVYLTFSEGSSIRAEDAEPRVNHLVHSSGEEQAYLGQVFRQGKSESRFLATSRRQHLFVPVHAGAGVLVLRFAVDQ